MTCPTCLNEDMPETCGVHKRGDECPCCGMVVLDMADDWREVEENKENGPES